MKQDRKWICILCILAALFLAAGDATDAYAKETSSKAVSISTKELSMAQGQTASLSIRNTGKEAKWKSSDKKVASVSKKGKVRAIKKGTAVITATVGKKKYKCNVTVSDKKTKTLIVYFSAAGTTKSAAKKIQKLTGGTLVCLQPEKAYTKNYDRLLDVAMQEQESDARPKLSTVIKNRKQYDTVILGYPIWHGKEPMIIRSFLEQNDLSGKKLIPFCTSGGSGISGSMAGIRKYAAGAEVAQGKDLSGTGSPGIKQWLKKAGAL